MALPAALGLWMCASPCISSLSLGFHVLIHVQAGMLPACFRLRVCNPRSLLLPALFPKNVRQQDAAPAGSHCSFTPYRFLLLSRVADPATDGCGLQTRSNVWVFTCGCFRGCVFVWVFTWLQTRSNVWVFSWMCFRVGVYVVANPQQRVGVYVGVFAWECLPPSPATIRLLDFWPRCLDYCQTAAVFVFFNQQRPDKARKFIIFAANGPRR